MRAHAGLLRQVLLRGRSPERGGRIGADRRDRRPVGSFAAGDHNAPHDAEGPRGVRWKRSQRMGYVCLSLVVVHVVVLGLRGWLAPQTWPWMLPPISLVAAVAAAVPLVVRRARERSRAAWQGLRSSGHRVGARPRRTAVSCAEDGTLAIRPTSLVAPRATPDPIKPTDAVAAHVRPCIPWAGTCAMAAQRLQRGPVGLLHDFTRREKSVSETCRRRQGRRPSPHE